MKGIILCLLEKLVVERAGPAAWDELVRRSALRTADGNFIRPAIYPDEDLYALMETASALTGSPLRDLYRAFGRATFSEHAGAYPASMPPGIRAKPFLRSVDRMMRIEVHKLQPGSHLPFFDYEDPAPDRLVMIYTSSRNLCDFAAGLIEGVGDHFGEDITQAHTQCRRDGYPHCRFELRFGPGRPA